MGQKVSSVLTPEQQKLIKQTIETIGTAIELEKFISESGKKLENLKQSKEFLQKLDVLKQSKELLKNLENGIFNIKSYENFLKLAGATILAEELGNKSQEKQKEQNKEQSKLLNIPNQMPSLKVKEKYEEMKSKYKTEKEKLSKNTKNITRSESTREKAKSGTPTKNVLLSELESSQNVTISEVVNSVKAGTSTIENEISTVKKGISNVKSGIMSSTEKFVSDTTRTAWNTGKSLLTGIFNEVSNGISNQPTINKTHVQEREAIVGKENKNLSNFIGRSKVEINRGGSLKSHSGGVLKSRNKNRTIR